MGTRVDLVRLTRVRLNMIGRVHVQTKECPQGPGTVLDGDATGKVGELLVSCPACGTECRH